MEEVGGIGKKEYYGSRGRRAIRVGEAGGRTQ